ncbi:hypothetical protein PMAG_a3234 [Pseudoalteromonas mariniglutinosa NCIMB 1770]|nr:hypothetical protein [Pseudoalteromonas mariniglutinosa NCIMB 1770]
MVIPAEHPSEQICLLCDFTKVTYYSYCKLKIAASIKLAASWSQSKCSKS